jgi:hypothetical protein
MQLKSLPTLPVHQLKSRTSSKIVRPLAVCIASYDFSGEVSLAICNVPKTIFYFAECMRYLLQYFHE